jgi:sulfur-oxidizing protein SoxY
MKMTGGISISEDPSFRFKYTENGAGKLTVKAKDTDGEVYEREFPTGTES